MEGDQNNDNNDSNDSNEIAILERKKKVRNIRLKHVVSPQIKNFCRNINIPLYRPDKANNGNLTEYINGKKSLYLIPGGAYGGHLDLGKICNDKSTWKIGIQSGKPNYSIKEVDEKLSKIAEYITNGKQVKADLIHLKKIQLAFEKVLKEKNGESKSKFAEKIKEYLESENIKTLLKKYEIDLNQVKL